MTEFVSQHLKDVHYFKDQGFNLDQTGISLILGNNLNAGSGKNSNGVGKSLFFSQLPEFIMGEPLIGSRADKVKKGTRTWEFRKGRNLYRVELSGPPTKYKIFKNNVDLGIHGAPECQAFIKNKIGMSDAEVKTFLYLDSGLPHPLVSGDTASRKAFFLDFFRSSLGTLDHIRKLIAVEYARLKGVRQEYDRKTARVKELKASLPPDLLDLRERYSVLDSKFKTMEERANRLGSITSLREQLESRAEEAELCEKLGIETEEDLASKLKSLEGRVQKYRVLMKKVTQYEEWKARASKVSADIKSARSRLNRCEHPAFSGISEDSLTRLSDRKTRITKKSAELETWIEQVEQHGQKAKKTVTLISQTVAELRHEIQHLKGKADKCPTCGSDYDNVGAKEKLVVAQRALSKLKTELNECQSVREKTEADALAIPEVRAKLRLLEEESGEVSSVLRCLKVVLENQDESQSVEDPGVTYEECDRRYQEATKLLTRVGSLETYLSIKKEYLSFDSASRKEARTFQASAIHEMAVKLSDLRVKIELADSNEKEIQALQSDRESLLEDLENEEAAELLTYATSKKGMERIMIRSLCKLLEAQVNKFAKYVFAEDYVFSFEMETQFNITVTRRHGKQEHVSDVRKLSGAERKLFSLILIPSLLSFVPKNQRCNVLILDEPSAAMGPSNVAAFIRFLPLLNSIIPHIVVITPLESSEYSILNPRVYVVEKKRGVSRIVEKV